MKALLISGGGSHGSFGVAKAEQLYTNNYDLIVGWSTGALIAPLAAIGAFDVLRDVYLNTNQKDVFSVNPFNKKGGVSIWNVIKRTILQKPTLGETLALKALIDKHYTEAHFNALQKSGKEVLIAASWLKSKSLHVSYFSSKYNSFERFKTAMWASATPLFYGSIVDIDGEQFTDAGAVELMGFERVLNFYTPTHIDAIVHRTRFDDMHYIGKVKRWWDFLGRISPAIMAETVTDDVERGAEYARKNGVDVNLHFMNTKPDFTSMVFDSKKMTELYYQSKK